MPPQEVSLPVLNGGAAVPNTYQHEHQLKSAELNRTCDFTWLLSATPLELDKVQEEVSFFHSP